MTLYSLCFYGRSFVRFQNKLFLLCCVSGAGREEPAPQEEAAVSHQDVQQQAAWEVCRARLHLGHSYVLNTHWNKTEHHAEDPPHKNCDILCPKGWLDDIGLPQYKDQFNDGRVDGQMLQYLTVVSVSITAEQDAGLKLVMYVVTFSENTWIWGACFTSLGFRLTSQKMARGVQRSLSLSSSQLYSSLWLLSSSERLVISQSDQPAPSPQHQMRHSCSPRQQVPP